MKKVRRIFKLRPMARSRIDPERLPLYQPASTSSGVRDRSPSIDSISTNSSSSSTQTRRPFRSYGSFLPNYFNLLRNSLRRSKSSQVRTAWQHKTKYIWMAFVLSQRKPKTFGFMKCCMTKMEQSTRYFPLKSIPIEGDKIVCSQTKLDLIAYRNTFRLTESNSAVCNAKRWPN